MCGIICAALATSKGHNGGSAFVWGIFGGLIAVAYFAIIPKKVEVQDEQPKQKSVKDLGDYILGDPDDESWKENQT